VSNGAFGHGGAYATNMNIDVKRGLVTVWMVQHAGFPGDGDKAQGEFKKALRRSLGRSERNSITTSTQRHREHRGHREQLI
jgi:CubicO group peptidase (beta-lactamase class C family)